MQVHLRVDFEDALFSAEQDTFGYRLCKFVDLVDNPSKGQPVNRHVATGELERDPTVAPQPQGER